MKTIYFTIIFCATINLLFSEWNQTEVNTTGNYISQASFVTADIGYLIEGSYGGNGWYNLKLFCTTNKGVDWNIKWTPPTTTSTLSPAVYFLNSQTGFVLMQTTGGLPHTIIIYKTADGGNSWNSSTIDQTNANNGELNIQFINDQTGYVAIRSGSGSKIYKTENGFYNWNTIFIPDFNLYDIKAISNILFIGGGTYLTPQEPKLFRSDDFGNSFDQVADMSNNNVGNINKMSIVSTGSTYLLICAGNYGLGYVTESNPNQMLFYAIPFYANNQNQYFYQDIIFTNLTSGYICAVYDDKKIAFTTDGGQGYNNWSNDLNFGSLIPGLGGMANIGDVIVETASDQLNLKSYSFVRQIPIHGQYTFDLISNPSIQGYFKLADGVWPGQKSLSVPDYDPQNPVLAFGGTFTNVENHVYSNVGSSIFYDWKGGYMNPNNGIVYTDRESDYVTANYKSKLISTSNKSLNPSIQIKALKDTNNNINVCYESMGGIFYTRSTDNGQSFGTEEIVNYSPTEQSGDNNYNPCLAEIKPYLLNYPAVYYSQNVAAVWEQRVGNDVKIRFSVRNNWSSNPYNWSGPIDLFTVSNVPSGFNCYPKLLMTKTSSGIELDSMLAVIYLKPTNNGGSQLWIYSKQFYYNMPGFNNQQIPIGENIKSFSVDYIMSNYAARFMDIHLAYEQNNKIWYNHGRLISDYSGPIFSFYSYPNPVESFDVSSGTTTWTSKSNPDLTLRFYNNSIQPVVAYEGQFPVNIKTPNGPISGSTYYPIVWRERLSGPTNWGNASWNLTTYVQKNCNLEGSRASNSYLFNFWSGNPQFYGFNVLIPKWNGSTNFHSSTPLIQTTDVKFMKGTIDRNAYNQQQVMTLSPSNNLFNVGLQTFQVSQTDPLDPGPDELSGTVVVDDIQYSFNLGCIIVNNQLINFNMDGDSAIEDNDDFANSMSSNPFLLHTNDTLIVGRNDFYLSQDSANNFNAITYSLNLVNNSTDQIFMTLEQDTIHLKDTVQLEYLEGFIIGEIPGGMSYDSFYVQIQIDTVWNVTGGGMCGISGGFSAITGGGNRVHSFKDLVFFKNVKENTIQIPTRFNISQNFPNPFNPVTKINYDIPRLSQVSIKVYDIIGREVTSLVNEIKQPGYYSVTFNGNNYASGVYFYRIQAGDFTSVKKMVLIK